MDEKEMNEAVDRHLGNMERICNEKVCNIRKQIAIEYVSDIIGYSENEKLAMTVFNAFLYGRKGK